jgi:hypothetical protein
MKQAFVPNLLEGIPLPGLKRERKPFFENTARPITFDAAEIAVTAAIAQVRAKRGVK